MVAFDLSFFESAQAAVGLGALATSGVAWAVRRVMLTTKQFNKVIETHNTLVSGLQDIQKQLRPNGGSSIFDLVSESAKESKDNAAQIKVVVSSLEEIRAYQFQAAEILAAGPVWHTDAEGNCTRVNLEYTSLAERTPAELIGAGWENFVLPSDRARVYSEWVDAAARKRAFESEFTVQSRSGKRYAVKAAASPVIKNSGEVVGYVGRYTRVTPVT